MRRQRGTPHIHVGRSLNVPILASARAPPPQMPHARATPGRDARREEDWVWSTAPRSFTCLSPQPWGAPPPEPLVSKQRCSGAHPP
nr:unnamed protein product [Digitaria exilis]